MASGDIGLKPFRASLVNPTGDSIIESSNGISISAFDYSNYDTNNEDGHARSDFGHYRYVIFTDPDGISIINSSFGEDGTTQISAAVSGDMKFDYIIPSIGDGLYRIRLITLPDWNNGATYLKDNCVYDPSTQTIYKSVIDNNTSVLSITTSWKVIDDKFSVPDKYNTVYYFARILDVENAKNQVVYNALINRRSSMNFFYDSGVRMIEILNMINSDMRDGLYTDVIYNFSLLTQIIGCMEGIIPLNFATEEVVGSGGGSGDFNEDFNQDFNT